MLINFRPDGFMFGILKDIGNIKLIMAYQTHVQVMSDLQMVEFPVIQFLHTTRAKHINCKQTGCVSEQKDSDETKHEEQCSMAVEFEKQLDEIAIWFENWNHDQRCEILEQLILMGNYHQFQFLWTSTQPILHRDFMYTSQDRFPDAIFTPISTEATRVTRQRLTRNRTIQRFHRAKSVYLRDENDVKSQFGLFTDVKHSKQAPDPKPMPLKLPAVNQSRSLVHKADDVTQSTAHPKMSWMTPMQIRRHMQKVVCDEGRSEPKVTSPNNSEQLYQWYMKWSGPQRATFLQLALMKLDPPQLYYVANYLAVRRHRDMLTLLPDNVARIILSYLGAQDLVNCAEVCTSWKRLCCHNMIWKRKCLETRMGVRPVATPLVGGWRSAYKEDRVLKNNWKEGTCLESSLFGHTDSVLAVAVREDLLVSGSKDCTVKVWSLAKNKVLQTFTGHQKGVWAVAIVTENLVASGSYDRTVKIWGLGPSGGCLRTLYGHLGPIWTMLCKNNYLASGSQDRLVKLWDMRHCVLHQTLRGHTSAVFCMDADDDMTTLFTGSADRTLRIWNIRDGRCIRVIWTGEQTSIMAVSCHDNILACASAGRVSIWDHSSGTRMRTFKAHKKRIESVFLQMNGAVARSGVIITGGKDGKIKFWNVYGKGKVKQLEAHRAQVNCVAADATRIISASYDGTIKVWDFRDSEN